MPIEFLLRPDNRLLAWSTGDFAHYGALPDASVTIARPDAAATPQPAPPAAPDENAGLESEPTSRAAESTPVTQSDDVAPPDHSFSGATPANVQSSPPEPVEATASLQPLGGSTAPGLLAQSTVADPTVADGSPSASAATQFGGTADALPAANPILSDLVPDTAALTAQSAQVDALIRGATDAIGAVTGAVDDALADVVAVQSGLIDTLAGVGGVASTALDGVGGLAQSSTLDIDQAIFSGADPGQGIATLVELVQGSELFAIGPATAPAGVLDTAGGVLDDVIHSDAVAAAAPLVGGDHDDALPVDLSDLHTGL